MANPIFTIGHSTHSIDEFIAMLKAHAITLLVDVRTMPRSRYNPQFNGDALEASLAAAGIGYRHMKELGGLRHPRKDSPNGAWRNSSFRGYADYMQSDTFETALGKLTALAKDHQVAIMCAESLPWRCHRSLIADALTVRHIPVQHIMSHAEARPHQLTEFAQVKGQTITYPVEDLFSVK